MALKKKHRRKPALIERLLGLAFVALVFVFIATFFWATWHALPVDLDNELIRAERAKRWTIQRAGGELAGTPELSKFDERLAAKGLRLGAPIFMRIFKKTFELEIWMKRGQRFHHFATYPICGYSGHLGPKFKEGDRQAPEGFYTVAKDQLNPNSRWHRSFNLGYPNAFDRSHGRTGSFLMVHGGCQSIGCYAMTDPVIDEIWSLVTKALDGGQRRFQVQAFPFRLTEEALNKRADHEHAEFWRNLKVGHDLFEANGIPPRISACQQSYEFKPGRAGSHGSDVIKNTCPDVTRTQSINPHKPL